jgi:hypothetical protein
MKGEALSFFKSKRIGLCVLHPIPGFAGKNVQVIQPDGKSYQSVFPALVSPHQPFLDIRTMKINTSGNVTAELEFKGDVFETEDQRNWGDNSYKTYGTPAHLPAPVQISPGDKMQQAVTLKTINTSPEKQFPDENNIAGQNIPFPRIGYSRGRNFHKLTSPLIQLFNKIPFSHYHVELDLRENDWEAQLNIFVDEAKQLNTKLELAVLFNSLSDKETASLISFLEDHKMYVESIFVLSANHDTPPADFFKKTYNSIKDVFPEIPVGYGTNGHFVDVNRNRPEGLQYDFLSFSLQPQAHLSDSRTIMENLGSHESLIRSANKISGNKPIHISPVTLNSRPQAGDSSAQPEPRQFTWFAAWWTLLAMENLSEAGHMTFYELTGDAGLVKDEQLSPIYQVLKQVKDFSPVYIIKNNDRSVSLENQQGERLIFRSALPDYDSY